MKIFLIGGTGLLGSEAASQLIQKGHQVVSIALPPLPNGALFPKEMELTLGSYLDMSDAQLLSLMTGCQGFIFAAGVDERVEGKKPIYALYEKFNILPLKRLLGLAKQAGIKHCVILGSYFAYWAKKHPELKLDLDHPYIASRLKQEEVALSFASKSFSVAILELPYIFGTQPGRQPVWTILLEQIEKMKLFTLYPKGGTAMVTVHQVGQAIVGALTKTNGGQAIPIGYFNLTWKQMLQKFHFAMGTPKKKIITVPSWLYQLGVVSIAKKKQSLGIEMGLNMAKFTPVMTTNLFISKDEGSTILGVTTDDLDAAIKDSVRLSLKALRGEVELLRMKGQ